jgi:hypothetical protein
MTRFYWLAVLAVGIFIPAFHLRADHPVPSDYPKSWELKFEHGLPKRIAVQVPGFAVPQAYWYMTYTVTNNSDKERMFFPNVELLCRDGKIIRSDKNIPAAVIDTIRKKEGNKNLATSTQLAGEIQLGEDQAKDGVAIWPEPMAEMGSFSIFVAGLSGEESVLKNDKGETTHLRKTLQLNFLIRGDDVYPGEDEVNDDAEEWIMR